MKTIDFLTNKTLREQNINEEKLNVLSKVKEIITIKGFELLTTNMVANYYEVGLETINSVIKRNREELENNGYKNYKRDEIIKIFESSDWTFKTMRGKTEFYNDETTLTVTNTGINLFNKRSLLNIGMLLTDSPVAEKVREMLLDNHEQLNEVHEKLLNGEDIEIDKTSSTYFIDKEMELRQQEHDLSSNITDAILKGDMNEYMKLSCQVNKIKEDLIALEKERAEINKPKIDGYNTFISTENLLSWDTVSKNLGIGRNKLLALLREHKILQTDAYKYNGKTYYSEHHNVPYQQYMKYFDVKFTTYNNKRKATTKVKATGQDYILKKLKEWKQTA